MKHIDKTKYNLIADTIKRIMIEKNYFPSRREIAIKLGIPQSTIYRYVQDMERKGIIKNNGKVILTDETQLLSVPILNSLSDPNHVYASPDIKDFVFFSKTLFNTDGQLAILTIPDNPMSKANIIKGNLLLVKRQNFADYGQIVLVLCADNKFYLRRYKYDEEKQKAVLVAESLDDYSVIENFEIRAVALRVISNLY